MTQQSNVFLTYENLAFSLPLLIVCGGYAYFKYIPLHIAVPILAVFGLIFQVRSHVQARKDNKLVNLDEDFIKDLAGDSEEAEKEKKEEDAVKARKAKAKLEQRLAIEQKKAKQNNGGKKKKKGGEVDEDDALETFVNKKTK